MSCFSGKKNFFNFSYIFLCCPRVHNLGEMLLFHRHQQQTMMEANKMQQHLPTLHFRLISSKRPLVPPLILLLFMQKTPIKKRPVSLQKMPISIHHLIDITISASSSSSIKGMVVVKPINRLIPYYRITILSKSITKKAQAETVA